jgi:C4-dicarboxylate transporter DctM subunit
VAVFGERGIRAGVIAIKLADISLITPRVGLNVDVVRSASPLPLTPEDVFSGLWPFLLLEILTLALLIVLPEIGLVLPKLML